MQRVKRSTAVAVLPAAPAGGTPGYFANPAPGGGVNATVPGYEWFNNVQEELLSVIEGQGLTASDADRTQLRQAIAKMIQTGQRAVIINGVTFAPAVATQGAAVYWDSANTRFDLAIADGSAKQYVVGFADVAGGNLYCFGDAVLFAGLTPGGRYFLSGTTAGAITTTAPANAVAIGTAKGATELFIDIDSSGVTATQFQQDLPTSAVAGGTADAITASFSPAITNATLSQGTVTLTIWPTGPNLTSTPSFTPNPGVVNAWTMVKGNNQALAPGDIAGAGHPITIQANPAAQKWVVLNPATAPGTVTPANDATYSDNSAKPASTSWIRGAMSAIATAAGFAISLAASGYIKFPSWLGGLIIQWGSVTIAYASVAQTITFPIAFPTSCLLALPQHSVNTAASWADSYVAVTAKTTTNFTTAYTSNKNWIAIGY